MPRRTVGGRAGVCLGFVDPFAGRIAVHDEVGVVGVSPLGHDETEVDRLTDDRFGCIVGSECPRFTRWCNELDPYRIGRRHEPPVEVRPTAGDEPELGDVTNPAES